MSGVSAEAGVPAVDREARRAMVRALDPAGPVQLDGIDVVEVLSNHAGTVGHVPGAPQQRTLLVQLLRGPVPPDLDADRVHVLGGARADPRINPVRVQWAHSAASVAGGVSSPAVADLVGVQPADRTLVAAAVPTSRRDRVLVVRTSSSGDWSTYVLALLGAGGVGVPEGFDEPLAREPFTFTVDCPNPLDCACTRDCPVPPTTSPLLDYLARDYPALRTRLLDRFAELVPRWRDTNPADPVVTLLELFAYVGDRLTSWQDAIAAEAYLPAARRRPSLRRHARLLDYRMHEGCAARTWLVFTVPPGPPVALPARTPVAALTPGRGGGGVEDALESGGTVFETIRAARLTAARNALALHAWGDVDGCLPAGATAAFVTHPEDADPHLAAGDVLVLAPVDEDEETVSGDEPRRRAVRLVSAPVAHQDPLAPGRTVLEIAWGPADALRHPLPVSRRRPDGTAGVAAVALANSVLAEHAAGIPGRLLEPPQVPEEGRYAPRLPVAGVAWVDETVDPTSATSAVAVDPRRARAGISLDDGARTWDSVPDLLGSGRLDAHLVAEPEESRQVRLRFGDGVVGRRPAAGDVPVAYVRVGGGVAGNVGAGVLSSLLPTPSGPPPAGVRVTNSLPAVGGVDPEPVEAVRELAPHAFRSQLRAVTSQDHAAVAAEVAGVQRAVARRRWTGSWHVQEVTLDVVAESGGGAEVGREVLGRLRQRRLAGVDVELAPPVPVPLEIVVGVCVADGYLRTDVRLALTRAMSSGVLPGGRRGFFHPDNFTFGQSLFVSDLVAAVMAVPGVAWVDVDDSESSGLRFRRLWAPPSDEVARQRIDAAAREVLRADGDPSQPENGRFDVILRGGA
ncbi:MAG: baseplate J/gp47 family protein [Actinomycetota bacterium]|nr:baseplate J/gp47 family protein [Actinomycetota bacterium]